MAKSKPRGRSAQAEEAALRAARIQAEASERSAQLQAAGALRVARYGVLGTLVSAVLVFLGVVYSADKKSAGAGQGLPDRAVAAAPGLVDAGGAAQVGVSPGLRRAQQPAAALAEGGEGAGAEPPKAQARNRAKREPVASVGQEAASHPPRRWTVTQVEGPLLSLAGPGPVGPGRRLELKSTANGQALGRTVACSVQVYPVCALTSAAESNLRALSRQVAVGDVFLLAY